jgi:hypothetical protein
MPAKIAKHIADEFNKFKNGDGGPLMLGSLMTQGAC